MAKDNTAATATAAPATAAPAASAPATTASVPAATASVQATPAQAPAAAVVPSGGQETAGGAPTAAQVAAWEYAGRQYAPGYALTEDDIKEFRRGVLRQDDYTRKTQRLQSEAQQFRQSLDRLYRDPTAFLEMFPREYQAQVAALLSQQDFGEVGEVDPRDVRLNKVERMLGQWQEEGKKRALMNEITATCKEVGDVDPEDVLLEMARGNPGATRDIAELVKMRNEQRISKWIEARKAKEPPPAPTPGQSVTMVGKAPTSLEEAKERALRRMGAR